MKQKTTLDQLDELSANQNVNAMRKLAKNAVFIAGRMALSGQITVFYAGPNTGKTLITLKLISEAIANGTVGRHVYHINLDDTYHGLITKADLGNRHGFQVLSSDVFVNPNANFTELVDKLIREGEASKATFILDTIKKFVDVMDKKSSSTFMSTCRKLTTAGGSIIALAHINKNRDDNDKGIPAGTSDILDDCDCAYVMSIVGEESEADGRRYTVEFSQSKNRGPNVINAAYGYQKYNDGDYERMFNTVKLLDGNAIDLLREKKARDYERNNDSYYIEQIVKVLMVKNDPVQKDILDGVDSSCSRRKTTECLKRWSCPPEEGGIWMATKGANNSNRYRLYQ